MLIKYGVTVKQAVDLSVFPRDSMENGRCIAAAAV